jgi:hypothetical protein
MKFCQGVPVFSNFKNIPTHNGLKSYPKENLFMHKALILKKSAAMLYKTSNTAAKKVSHFPVF